MPKVEIDLRKFEDSCFVIMPFAPVFGAEYRDIIEPAVTDCGLRCIRADEIYSKPNIISDIWKNLRSARVVIAELSGKNTNVFYELGIAHTLGKPVINITRNEEDVPFDLKALRYLHYDITNPSWGSHLRESLAKSIKSILNEEDYGAVFDDIKVIGKTKFVGHFMPPLKGIRVSDDQKYNLNGFWKGKMVFESEQDDLDLELRQERFDLYGQLIVKIPTNVQQKKEIEIIEEKVLGGCFNGFDFILNGISYTFLRKVTRDSYNLDRFLGKVSTDGNQLFGEVTDALGNKGKFTLERA